MKTKITVSEWLKSATESLKLAGVDSARLDALILLEDATGVDRANILAHPEVALAGPSLKMLNAKLERRANREPLAYIRGFCEFYGRKFLVNKDVLIPRPESESFIELLAAINPKSGQTLLDVGTGSGVLAITAKLENPFLDVLAMDISEDALKVAKNNTKKLCANIKFLQADFTAGILPKTDVILANLPYLPKDCEVSPEVYFEPKIALYAPMSGLGLIEQLAPLARQALNSGGYILIESLPEHLPKVKNIYHRLGFKNTSASGLMQCFQKH